jgi:hypothetical protein
MATPDLQEKVWLSSYVTTEGPVLYSDLTTAGPVTSTMRAPRTRSTKRQGRSMIRVMKSNNASIIKAVYVVG